MLKYLVLVFFSCPFATTAQAAPWAAQKNSLYTESQTRSPYTEKFRSGNMEIESSIGLNSDFELFPQYGALDFSFRMAPTRRLSLGLSYHRNSQITVLNENTFIKTPTFSIGPEIRWYFYEARRFALSLTQKIHWATYEIGPERIRVMQSHSELLAHAFLTPAMSMNFGVRGTLNPLTRNTLENLEPGSFTLAPKFGLTYRF